MSALPLQLLPDNAAVDADGQATIGGLRLTDLAAEFGTPLFVYDEDHLRARCREAVTAFGPGVAYASKAFLCTAMARLAHEEGMRIDVASGGELHVVLVGRRPGRRSACFHGNNKSVAELTRPRSRLVSAGSWSTASTSSTASMRCSAPTARSARTRSA